MTLARSKKWLPRTRVSGTMVIVRFSVDISGCIFLPSAPKFVTTRKEKGSTFKVSPFFRNFLTCLLEIMG